MKRPAPQGRAGSNTVKPFGRVFTVTRFSNEPDPGLPAAVLRPAKGSQEQACVARAKLRFIVPPKIEAICNRSTVYDVAAGRWEAGDAQSSCGRPTRTTQPSRKGRGDDQGALLALQLPLRLNCSERMPDHFSSTEHSSAVCSRPLAGSPRWLVFPRRRLVARNLYDFGNYPGAVFDEAAPLRVFGRVYWGQAMTCSSPSSTGTKATATGLARLWRVHSPALQGSHSTTGMWSDARTCKYSWSIEAFHNRRRQLARRIGARRCASSQLTQRKLWDLPAWRLALEGSRQQRRRRK
jgi:hypothetical protein